MTEHSAIEKGGRRKSRVARRRFLSGVGAGGLAAAAVVFGRPTAAQAVVSWQCCTLCFARSISMTTCRNAARHYIWGCTTSGGFLHCTCCERGTTSRTCSGVNASAGSCQYG
jgi:hypothetical protein